MNSTKHHTYMRTQIDYDLVGLLYTGCGDNLDVIPKE